MPPYCVPFSTACPCSACRCATTCRKCLAAAGGDRDRCRDVQDRRLQQIQDEKPAILRQAAIDVHHQDRNDVRAMFAAFDVNAAQCDSFCDWFTLDHPWQFQYFTPRTDFAAYVQDTLTPGQTYPKDYSRMEDNVTACYADFKACGFDFAVFCTRHANCVRVLVDETNRTGYVPRPSYGVEF